MEQASLRFRLLVAWLVFVLLTLQVAGIGLRILFERGLKHRAIAELTLDLRRLAAGLELQEGGAVRLSDIPRDPQYVVAYSGKYWQVSQAGKPILRSPSLWDHGLVLAAPPLATAEAIEVRLVGPNDQSLFGIARSLHVANGARRAEFQIISAIDDAEIVAATRKFTYDLVIGLGGFGALLLAAAAALVSFGLRPLQDLRERLSAVRNGEINRLEGTFPTEVMPLVAETNALLEAQDDALDVARTRAGNLAHGLKTPLAVMATQGRSLRRRGDMGLADIIDKQVEAMRRHVERELARSRQRDTGTARYRRIDAARVVAEIASALQHLPKGAELDWRISVPASLMLPVERADFVDIMGNLLDNAQKWARHRVEIDGRAEGDTAIFRVEDDGNGVPEDQFERIRQRGERADTSVPGTGLGLDIVSDLVGLYGGHLELAKSPLGGLSAEVALPLHKGGRSDRRQLR